ncbi:bifunctional nuclease family protein [Salidesulfovibrio brasiliensis]|uniref:bifunctional nuclease family protein n=1 Tax=Salidesulfovibrio brasiliensis TaxID=221711 RepID=UPI0006D27D5F|nr:bifunctional nuclease family protein [Salidesulfovibrio brasiliensis]
MVAMKIFGLALEEKGQAPIILLQDEESNRVLPIWIGAAEAMSISMALNDVPFPRPMTHDLLVNTIKLLGGRLDSVEITEISEGTFYAELVVNSGENELRVDCRPSDGVALAVRVDAEIRVSDQVLDAAGMPMENLGDKVVHHSDSNRWKDLLEGLDEDETKYKM